MSDLPLAEMNYFGTSWYTIEKDGPSAAFVLRSGYANARVERGADGLFFAGVVERLDDAGRVTDVVLAFAGTQPGSVPDIMTDLALLLSVPDAQTARAVALYDALLADPRYADATIHVTGHSLGGMLTQYVLGHSLATYGADVTAARADFVAFAAPPAGHAIADAFGLTPADFAGHVDGYTVVNDATQVLGTGAYLGTQHFLATYAPFGPLGIGLNAVAAHHPSAFLGGLGLPDWLSPAEKAGVIAAVAADGDDLLYTPAYGADGPVARTVFGDAAANAIVGTAHADVISGGGGGDMLTGGGGGDRFVFARVSDSSPVAPDMILDFDDAAGDRIDLSAIDARADRIGNNAFAFIGDAPITAPGQVAVRVIDGISHVFANVSGDATPELAIIVHSAAPLTAADFIL